MPTLFFRPSLQFHFDAVVDVVVIVVDAVVVAADVEKISESLLSKYNQKCSRNRRVEVFCRRKQKRF